MIANLRNFLLCLAIAPAALAVPLPKMHPSSVFNQPISGAPAHPASQTMIEQLTALGGFGNNRLQIDFSFYVLYADASTPLVQTTSIPGPGNGYYDTDCEPLGGLIALPSGGAIEGQSGYTCDNLSGDCHLLVVRGNDLIETYRANLVGGQMQTQCVANWRLDGVYASTLRGDHCTSADAAGFPIAPLLFNADELAALVAVPDSDLGHAIRFILPNARMASDAGLGGVLGRLYVRPGTHAGAPSGPSASVPYGSRLRLAADFPLTGYNPAAQVLLRTMKRYGIVLADGGTVALTAESDRYTTAKWADLGISARVFDQTAGARKLFVSDFQVLDTGARIAETYDCVRTQPQLGQLFANGFE